MLDMWQSLLDQLDDRKEVTWDACRIDGMFSTAKKGVRWSGSLRKTRE
jgi:hypothetical protein